MFESCGDHRDDLGIGGHEVVWARRLRQDGSRVGKFWCAGGRHYAQVSVARYAARLERADLALASGR